MSRKVDECKPLLVGATLCSAASGIGVSGGAGVVAAMDAGAVREACRAAAAGPLTGTIFPS